jgi:hypothetical protein
MKQLNDIAIILSAIAIILSLVSIVMIASTNNRNFVTQEQFTQEHDAISTALQEEDFAVFERDLVFYHGCINDAIDEFVRCVDLGSDNEQVRVTCSPIFNEARYACENGLKQQLGL